MTERQHPSGLPYRAGVGILLLNDANHVFVGQRLDSTLEAWQMPQGGIDPGEQPVDTAFRELAEETGITHAVLLRESRDWLYYDLPAELIGTIWKGRYCGQRQKWFAMRFTGGPGDINIATPHPEFRSWRWSPVDQLVDLIVPFKRDLYAAVLAEFSDLIPGPAAQSACAQDKALAAASVPADRN